MNISNDYQPARDDARLKKQGERIFEVCKSGRSLTLSQIAYETGAPEASISARLRHFRKIEGGSHVVDKEYLGSGLYAYTLIVNDTVCKEPEQLSLFDVVRQLGSHEHRATKEYYSLVKVFNTAKVNALDTLESINGFNSGA